MTQIIKRRLSQNSYLCFAIHTKFTQSNPHMHMLLCQILPFFLSFAQDMASLPTGDRGHIGERYMSNGTRPVRE